MESCEVDYEDLLNICSFITNRNVKHTIGFPELQRINAYLELLKSNVDIDEIKIGNLFGYFKRFEITLNKDLQNAIQKLEIELKNNTNIKFVEIDGIAGLEYLTILDFPCIILENPHLQEFSIQYYPINLNTIKSIAKSISNHTSLNKLTLQCFDTPKEYIHLLAEGLRKNKTISSLDIRIPSEIAKDSSEIYEALKDSTLLQELRVTRGKYNIETIKNIQEILITNSLKVLDLNVELDIELIDNLFDAVSFSKTLEKISISGIKYPKRPIKSLEKMLLYCNKLKKFTLFCRKINLFVCEAISNALQNNCKIEDLSLNTCRMDNNCLKKICKALPNNKKIKTLDLHNNRFSNKCSQIIIDTLKLNTTIAQINLKDNKIKLNAQDRIKKAILSSDPYKIIIF